MRSWLPIAIAAAVAGVILGRCSAPDPPAPSDRVVTVVDSVDASHWRAETERLEHELRERTGRIEQLTARIRGLEARPPELLERYDTLVVVDTVPVYVGGLLDRGWLTLYGVGRADSLGLRQPETYRGIDVRDCDSGIAIGSGGRVVCDRPALGHLQLVARPVVLRDSGRNIGLAGELAARWRRCHRWDRCPYAGELRVRSSGRVEVAAEVGWTLF